MKDIYIPNTKTKLSRKVLFNFIDKELHASNYILDDIAENIICDDDIERLKEARHLLRYKFISLLAYNKFVLDYGCGNGYGAYMLSKNAERVIAVDTDKTLISSAIKTYKKDNLIFFPVPHLPTKMYETPFDLITCIEVLEHIDPKYIDRFVCKLKDMLDDKGLIVFTTPRCKETIMYKEDITFKMFHSHYREYNKDDFIDILERNDLKIEQYILQKFEGSIVYQIPKNTKFPPISPRVWVQIAICTK